MTKTLVRMPKRVLDLIQGQTSFGHTFRSDAERVAGTDDLYDCPLSEEVIAKVDSMALHGETRAETIERLLAFYAAQGRKQ